jgi:hypothetical protein
MINRIEHRNGATLGSDTSHAINCKRVTCLLPAWHFSNKARRRPRPHSSTLSQHILCTYQNRPLRRAPHTDTNVTLEHPLHRYSSHPFKGMRIKTSLCTPDNHNKASMANHHRFTSPRTVINNMFLTFQHGGSMVQLRSWACNLARVLFRRARTTSKQTFASCTRIHRIPPLKITYSSLC